MFFIEMGVILMIVLAFGLLAPRAGLIVGPVLVLLGLVPLILLFFVPAGSRARVEEQYGMLATLAFVGLTPSGLLLMIVSVFARRE